MRTKIINGLLLSVSLVFFLFITPCTNAASPEEEVLQVAADFTKAVDTWDFDLISSLYWHSEEISYFGPKRGSAFLTCGWEAIEKENDSMREFPKGSISWAFHNLQVTMLGDNAAIIAGYAIVNINPPLVEETKTDQNRLTIVVKKIGGKWLIVHRHESFFPTE